MSDDSYFEWFGVFVVSEYAVEVVVASTCFCAVYDAEVVVFVGGHDWSDYVGSGG